MTKTTVPGIQCYISFAIIIIIIIITVIIWGSYNNIYVFPREQLKNLKYQVILDTANSK